MSDEIEKAMAELKKMVKEEGKPKEFVEIIPETPKKKGTQTTEQQYMHEGEYRSVDELKAKVGTILHPPIPEQDLVYVEPDHEAIRKASEISALNSLRAKIKLQFPKIRFKETREAITSIRLNSKCMSCRFYTTQCSIPEVKDKIRGSDKFNMDAFKIRMYRNKDENLEDARGLCSIPISMSRHSKFMVNRPDISVCSDWVLHHDINTYFDKVNKMLDDQDEAKREKQQERDNDLKRKEDAQKIIDEYNLRHPARRGRPRKD